jgi:hypothetical protein
MDLTNYESWQMEKYGNIAPLTEVMPDGTFENGAAEMERLAEWVSLQAEIELNEKEIY